jgi:hypothetical protein
MAEFLGANLALMQSSMQEQAARTQLLKERMEQQLKQADLLRLDALTEAKVACAERILASRDTATQRMIEGAERIMEHYCNGESVL